MDYRRRDQRPDSGERAILRTKEADRSDAIEGPVSTLPLDRNVGLESVAVSDDDAIATSTSRTTAPSVRSHEYGVHS